MGLSNPVTGGVAYRIRSGQRISASGSVLTTGGVITPTFLVEFDDGTYDNLLIPDISLSAIADFGGISNPCAKNGWVTAGFCNGTGTDIQGDCYVVFYIQDGVAGATARQIIAKGYVNGGDQITLGQFQQLDFYATYVFQGTVAEDVTVGTHVCTLTVTPGAGNSMMLIAGTILEGNTATVQTATAYITDGTNVIANLLFGGADATANTPHGIPTNQGGAFAAGATNPSSPGGGYVISGAMQLVLKVTTAAVSVTQTFSVVCRLKGTDMPTATLADTVGAPTLTANTNALF